MENKIKDIINLISNVTNLFYQNKVQEAYQKLQQLLEALAIVVDEFYQGGILGADDTTILEILKEVMCAMEKKDTLLVADMLEYELKDALLKLKL